MEKGTLLGEGRTAAIYGYGERHILKLFHEGIPASWAEHELRVARLVEQAGLDVPSIGEAILEVEGRNGLLYERVDGCSMLQWMAARPWITMSAARQFARLHVEMHNRREPTLPAQREQLDRAIQRAPGLSEPARAQAREALARLPGGDSICHGDFHPDNVLMAARGPVVIDWTTATSGEPAGDVARTTLLLLKGGLPPGIPLVRRALFEVMRRLFYRAYMREYRAHRPAPRAAIAAWLPVLAAARLAEQVPGEEEYLSALVEGAFG